MQRRAKKEAVKERRGWRQLLSPDGTAMRITIKRQTCSRIHTQACKALPAGRTGCVQGGRALANAGKQRSRSNGGGKQPQKRHVIVLMPLLLPGCSMWQQCAG